VQELCGEAGRWRVRFEAAPPLREDGFEPQDDGTHLVEADGAEALERKLGVARARGALLVELRPEAKDLETVLREVLRR
jgi:hypothetical protein